ncbi:EAL domain-containing protein [uncultured Thalassolituus sp.]|uniref:bifunctional diguanylate cyclase/phosphodiesterase n=1 Tax=uncultured Thalassolituus sp. TaxID=285273 RepID=UPI0026398AF0|nr:EAL domain-containing protein [uncultured Thalassolituus sp.]
MTLRQQFSLLTSALVVVLLVGNLMLTVMNGRDYFQQQLNARAYDAATSLALSMSQISADDTVQQTRLMDVLFDRGFFEDITFARTSGEELHRRARQALDDSGAPAWFKSVAPLELMPAEADVTRGWSRLGTIRVTSHSDFAYRDLWNMVRAELIWFAWVLLISLLLLQVLLRFLFRPLVAVEQQALAICERDWQVQEEIPRARELARVVLAMNKMVSKLQAIFSEQAQMTERLREESYLDAATGLLNRRGFDQRFEHILSRDDEHSGVLIIMQLQDFADYNLNAGRQAGDDLLSMLGRTLEQWRGDYPNSILGRRAGADFALFVPCADRAQAEEIVQQTFSLLSVSALSQRNELSFHVGGVFLQGLQDDPVVAFSRADAALRQAQRQPTARYVLYRDDAPGAGEWTATEWRVLLTQVLEQEDIRLQFLPVISNNDKHTIQYEVFSRIEWQGETLSAARFWPMVEQHRLASRYDLSVIRAVLGQMRNVDFTAHPVRFCINLSPASVIDEGFHQKLISLFGEFPEQARYVALEVPEFALYSAEHAIARLALMLQPLGVVMGIDQVGTGTMAFAYLQRLPLDYVRIDGSFNRGVHQAQDHRFYIQSMVQIAHNLDLLVLAEGLEEELDVAAVRQTGVDGLGGYFYCRPMPSLEEALAWQPF